MPGGFARYSSHLHLRRQSLETEMLVELGVGFINIFWLIALYRLTNIWHWLPLTGS